MEPTTQQHKKKFSMENFSGLKLMLASPEVISEWSYGEVLKPETINYRTFKPEKDGLFDERIFGPTKDFECYCGKYKRIRYKGIICDRCGVEVTASAVRRERMGHIKLATPIAHIWYFKGASSPLSVLLGITSNNLERVIYFALYLVCSIDDEKRVVAEQKIADQEKQEYDRIEEWYVARKTEIEAEETQAKEDTSKKVKNKEQLELTIQEVQFKYREKLATLLQQYDEKKAEQRIFFERISKIVKAIKPLDTLEEEDYMYLEDIGAQDFMVVGMGSEVLMDVLTNLDLQEEYKQLVKKLLKSKGDKKLKLLKKARLLEAFIKSEVQTKWMIFSVLPVIPPDLRPVVQLSGGKFATSDLNDFYRRVINRNNRLRHLMELGAPEIILRNEKRMLQESVDSLIDLTKSRGGKGRQVRAKQLKSLSDVLKGKQGRFRQNLLGKRVDYSGRSVIIGGPDLKLNQCGLPKEMALELFKPFLLHEVILRGHAQNIRSAKNFLESKDPVIYDILEEITKDHPVLLNRAPTLHKLSILGFYPVLTDDYAIKLHPTVCSGYNADFDGDQMGVYVPLSKTAIQEVKDRMLPQKNLLKPADGTPIVVPAKEMALGCYYLTTLDSTMDALEDKELRVFSSQNEALVAYELGIIKTREAIMIRVGGDFLRASVGRVLFNNALHEEMRFVNEPVRAGDIKTLIEKAIKLYNDDQKVAELIDNIKEIGFWGATISGGVSVSPYDCLITEDKDELIHLTEDKVYAIDDNYNQGLITLEEKRRLIQNLWIELTERLADKTWDLMGEENPAKIIIKSGGARASREQLKQLSAMKGLVIDPLGKIIEVPTKSNYRQGLTIFEYIINTRGARKGLIDSALKTADAGYLTRRLVDVSHDMIIREEDCEVAEGLTIESTGIRENSFTLQINGRYLAEPLMVGKKKIADRNDLITPEFIATLDLSKPLKVVVRSALLCKTEYGCCQKCYGIDYSTKQIVEIGTPVGVLAAQSIGEPGTQLTMRVRHFGGIVIADVTQGLPRVDELFEIRTPKSLSPLSDISGKVTVKEDKEKNVYRITIETQDKNADKREYMLPLSRKLNVKSGQLIGAGHSICDGYLDVKEILAVQGLKDAQMYLLSEVQRVYESQGIAIHDKHFEVIIRKMSDKIIVESEGDTKFIIGEVVSRYRFERENKKVLSQGGRPSVGRITILGVSRASQYSDSWLSAASFQYTTKVLTEASIKGQIDRLLGLKENVIIGRLIPVTAELLDKYYNNTQAPVLADGPSEEPDSADADDVVTEISEELIASEEDVANLSEVVPDQA